QMRPQLTVFSIALLCATIASAAQPAGQPAPLDRVLGQLHDIRAARASNPKRGKISSRLLPPPTVGPVVGGLAVAPPPRRADVLRAQGLDGNGVVVGVISDGIDSVQAAQATHDLPDVVVPNDLRCQRGAGDEGTALLEIVHDVAPGAKLLFSGPASSLDMIDTVECLVDAGANVIVDDLGFFGEPYFE